VLRFIIGLVVTLHGLVHLLYFGQSWRFFELQPGMVWPDGSWVFSRLLGDKPTRLLASVSCIAVALVLVAGGSGIILSQAWWRLPVVSAAAFSTVIFILFWDGHLQRLDDQGGIGLLINLVILAAVLLFGWPHFAF